MLDSKAGHYLLEQGYPAEEINQIYDQQRQFLVNKGYPESDINKAMQKKWGISDKPVTPFAEHASLDAPEEAPKAQPGEGEETPAPKPVSQDILNRVAATVEVKPWFESLNKKPEVVDSIGDAALAGYQGSATGLLMRGQEPNMYLTEDASFAEKAVYAATLMASELPISITAGIAGSPGGPATSMAAAGAAPAAVRQWLLESYEHGDIKTMDEGIRRLLSTAKVAGEEGFLSLVTLKAGTLTRAATAPMVEAGQMSSKVATGLAAYAELNAGAYTGAALQRRAVNADDFTVAASLMYGQRTVAMFTGKLKNIYAFEGVSPQQARWMAKTTPTAFEDLGSVNLLTPRILTGMKKAHQRVVKTFGKDSPEAAASQEHLTSGEDFASALAKGLKESDVQAATTAADKFHHLYTSLVDRMHPLNKGAKINETTESYKNARLLPALPAKASSWMKHATMDFATQKPNGESLQDIISGIKDVKHFESWLQTKQHTLAQDSGVNFAAKMKNFINKKKKQADALEVLDENTADVYNTAYQGILKYQENLINYAKDSGLLTDHQYKTMRNQQDLFAIYDDNLTFMSPVKMQRVFGANKAPNPVEALIHNTHTILKGADTNSVKQLAAKEHGAEVMSASATADQVWVQEGQGYKAYATSEFDKAFVKMKVMEHGETKQYAVPKEIAEVFNGLDRTSVGLLTKLAAKPASLLRAGTAITPDFVLKNFWRDGIQASVNSKHGFIFGIDTARGLFEIMGSKMYEASGKKIPALKGMYDTYTEWVRSGGANSALVSIDRDYLGETAKSLYAVPIRNKVSKEGLVELGSRLNILNQPTPVWKTVAKMPYGAVKGVAKTALHTMQVLSETSDQATRLAEYRKARLAGKSATDAAYASREVTQDFARMGAKTQAYNMITAFANAQIQGTDRFAREFASAPLATVMKAQAGVVLPSLLLGLVAQDIIHNSPDTEMAEALKNIPEWEKNMYWHIPGDDNVLYRVPKPFELGAIFGSTTERFLEHACANKKINAGEVLNHFWETGLVGSIGEATVPSMMPQALGAPIEIAANHSFFNNLPLIPVGQENLMPEYQSTMMTSELSQSLSKAINELVPFETNKAPGIVRNFFSPIGIDHIIKSWTGGTGRYAIAAVENAYEKMGWESVENKPDIFNLKHPFTRAFTVRYPTTSAEPVTKFRDRHGEAERVYNSVMMKMQSGDMDKQTMRLMNSPQFYKFQSITQTFRNISSTVKKVYYAPGLSKDEKFEIINGLYKQMIDVSVIGNHVIDVIENKETN